MFKKFIINCDQATTICDKSQYNEASFFEKFKLNLHLLSCKICGMYVKQNRTMTKVLKIKTKENNVNCLSKIDKEALKKEFEKIKE